MVDGDWIDPVPGRRNEKISIKVDDRERVVDVLTFKNLVLSRAVGNNFLLRDTAGRGNNTLCVIKAAALNNLFKLTDGFSVLNNPFHPQSLKLVCQTVSQD